MSNLTTRDVRPDFVPPPGATLEELLDERGMTQAQLALQMNRPRKTINEIVRGKAAIESDTALQLERVLGLPAEFWMRREAEFRAFCARSDERKRLARSVSCLRSLPVRAMIRHGWIEPSDDRVELLTRCLDFFHVARPEQFDDLALVSGVAFRRATKFRSDPHALAAWLRRGEMLAEQRSAALPPFDAGRFRALMDRSRALSLMPVREATEKLCRSCADVGVVVLFVPELPKTHVSGASRWIFERPMIQLSLRYKTDDQLWFTFFHEAAHVLLHARGTYVDEDRGASSADDSREAEANDFAAAALVPPAQLAEFVLANKPFSKAAIRTFASRIGVAPGVVVGQLQHRDDLPRAYCNDLKVRIEDGLIDEFASR